MRRRPALSTLLLILFTLPAISVHAQDVPADTVAQRLLQGHGADAWASAPYLRFNFAVERDGTAGTPIRHFWDRASGQYRVEWTARDTTYVGLINVQAVANETPDGEVYADGNAIGGPHGTDLRKQAYRRFINDTYWLLAPLKVMDPGVNRSYVADSSDATHHVLHLTFGDVGLTPGDQYWLYVNRETGRLDRWAFHLESMPDDATPAAFQWTEYVTLDAPHGTVHLAKRHASEGSSTAILTESVALPSTPPDGVFTDPMPLHTDE